jgi:hypothetical protein
MVTVGMTELTTSLARLRPRSRKGAIRALVVALLAFGIAARCMAADKAPVVAHDASPQRSAGDGAPLMLPEDVRVPIYEPGPTPLRPGERLVYRISWIGIPAATATVTLNADGPDSRQWTAQGWITTERPIDLLFRMRDYVREDFDQTSYDPHDVFIRQDEKRRLSVYTATFDSGSHVVTAIKRHRDQSEIHRFGGGNAFGPFSAAALALTQRFEVGRRLVFDVFGGANRYVFSFDIDGQEKLRTALGDFDTFRVIPSVLYASNPQYFKQARRVVLWISADPRRLPLRLEASTFIGTVRADLIRIEEPDVLRPAANVVLDRSLDE